MKKLIVDNMCYIANLGDSRAIMSLNKGKELKMLTNDHKPSEQDEVTRIIKAGGKVYQ
jgi:protein phosphatase 2C family protein 2/3